MPERTIMVAGLGRCGTSLVMQMLHAGGMECVGRYPDFEVEQVNHKAVHRKWFREQCGKAMKWLTPLGTPIPDAANVAVIWLDRDPFQQARSQLKFLSSVGIMGSASRTEVRQMAASIKRDRKQTLKRLSKVPLIKMNFEGIICEPGKAAARLHTFLRWSGHATDIDEMAKQVIPRSPKCSPNMRIESLLVSSVA